MFIETLRERGKSLKKKIVLPESTDIRPIKAASTLVKENLAGEVVLLGDADDIKKLASDNGVSIDGINIINPKKSSKCDEYASLLYDRRKHKGMTEDDAKKAMSENVLYYGAAMVAKDDVDGMVAGSINSTGDVIRASLFLVGLEEGINTLSSLFVMIHPDTSLFEKGVYIFADSGVVPNPTDSQLADITISTASSFKSIVGADPKVALLSFSTMGSAKDPLVDKVLSTKAILDSKNLGFDYDGELQFDAAMIPSVAKLKAPNSKVAGVANTFIFPDLNAGNICYKAAERLSGGTAIGPILQGLAKPINDLSRGCNDEDIVLAALITSLQTVK